MLSRHPPPVSVAPEVEAWVDAVVYAIGALDLLSSHPSATPEDCALAEALRVELTAGESKAEAVVCHTFLRPLWPHRLVPRLRRCPETGAV